MMNINVWWNLYYPYDLPLLVKPVAALGALSLSPPRPIPKLVVAGQNGDLDLFETLSLKHPCT